MCSQGLWPLICIILDHAFKIKFWSYRRHIGTPGPVYFASVRVNYLKIRKFIYVLEMLIVCHLGTPNSDFNGCHCMCDPVLYRSMLVTACWWQVYHKLSTDMLQVDCNKPDFNRLVDKLQEACKLGTSLWHFWLCRVFYIFENIEWISEKLRKRVQICMIYLKLWIDWKCETNSSEIQNKQLMTWIIH